MTRFARARGSKASNDRIPDESTPWHVMKQQLEDSVELKKTFKEKKCQTATVLLQDLADEPYYGNAGSTVNHDWAEFESENKTASSLSLKNNKFKKFVLVNENIDDDSSLNDNLEKNSSNFGAIQKTIITNEISKVHNDGLEFSALTMRQEQIKNERNKGQLKWPIELKKSIKIKKIKHDQKLLNFTGKKLDIEETDYKNLLTVDNTTIAKLSKRQKRNRKNKMKLLVNGNGNNGDNDNPAEVKKSGMNKISFSSAFNTEENEWSTDIKFGYDNQARIIKYKPDDSSNFDNINYLKNNNNNFNTIISERFNNKHKIIKQRRPPKTRDDKEHKRKRPHPGATKVIINGIEIEIVMYDGFPIKREDADRLKELRQQMVMKAIPKSEIDIAIKMERRKAEKNLARIKKNVCFHCRKSGHNLSDCPDLGKEEAATGICFKCGSTEHTHFQCKINKKEEFGYAKCFICREQGHIAKQCPDNPKGLYPNGGACKICGDVTHLKRDCPDFLKDKKETTVVVNTIDNDIIEYLENGEEKKLKKRMEKIDEKVKNKIVKF